MRAIADTNRSDGQSTSFKRRLPQPPKDVQGPTELRGDVRVQVGLNAADPQGIAVGDLLVRELEDQFLWNSPTGLRDSLLALAALVGKRATVRRNNRDLGVALLHFRTGEHAHMMDIERAVRRSATPIGGSMVVGRNGDVERSDPEFRFNFSWTDVGGAAYRAWRTRTFLRRRLSREAGSMSVALWVTLFRKLILLESIRHFLAAQSQVRLVTGDFDRGDLSSVWFVAARCEKIASASLQHGVIFPGQDSAGWAPLIADQIFVWGPAARRHLESVEQVPPARIVEVGNPSLAANAGPPPSSTSRQTSRPWVVLALSSPDEVNDRHLVGMFAAMHKHPGLSSYEFTVKLHPGRNPKDFGWVEEKFGLRILPRDLSRTDLIGRSAAVLVTTTTLGVELLAADVPVGVIDAPEVPLGFGRSYVEDLSVPPIRHPDELVELVAGGDPIDTAAVRDVLGDPVGARCEQALRKLLDRPSRIREAT